MVAVSGSTVCLGASLTRSEKVTGQTAAYFFGALLSGTERSLHPDHEMAQPVAKVHQRVIILWEQLWALD